MITPPRTAPAARVSQLCDALLPYVVKVVYLPLLFLPCVGGLLLLPLDVLEEVTLELPARRRRVAVAAVSVKGHYTLARSDERGSSAIGVGAPGSGTPMRVLAPSHNGVFRLRGAVISFGKAESFLSVINGGKIIYYCLL